MCGLGTTTARGALDLHASGEHGANEKKASECQRRLKRVHDAQRALNVRPGHFHGERCSLSILWPKKKPFTPPEHAAKQNQASASADCSEFRDDAYNGV